MLAIFQFALLVGATFAHPYTRLGFAEKRQSTSAPAAVGQPLTVQSGVYMPTYDAATDVFKYRNVRFAAPPVGDLRFAKPSPPVASSNLQNSSYGPICISASSGGTGGFGGLSGGTAQSEDCLFLDVYVPGRAMNGSVKGLPVVHWIYGGGYISGSKENANGTPLVVQSGGNMIFVTGNYRLGAYGFLGGTTVEKEAVPNVGLYDQRMALQWIKDNIAQLGGNPNDVSAWGESAGAGSIMHHLTAFGGAQDPLFSKAVLQSPAFYPVADRQGLQEQNFQTFEAAAGCQGQGFTCLRAKDTATIQMANQLVVRQAPPSTFGFGPVADGQWVRQLPSLELASGRFWKNMQSLILSHVANEAEIFVSKNITDDSQFSTLLSQLFPNQTAVNEAVLARYPPVMQSLALPQPSTYVTNIPPPYLNESDRDRALLQDSSFTCNVRFLADAYAGKTFNLQYSHAGGLHGIDTVADFFNPNSPQSNISLRGDPTLPMFAPSFQTYLTSHARSGDPNTFQLNSTAPGQIATIKWPMVTNDPGAEMLSNVLNATTDGFSLIEDNETGRQQCAFWQNVEAAVTNSGGYAPPDAIVQSSIPGAVVNPGGASVNFQTPSMSEGFIGL